MGGIGWLRAMAKAHQDSLARAVQCWSGLHPDLAVNHSLSALAVPSTLDSDLGGGALNVAEI